MTCYDEHSSHPNHMNNQIRIDTRGLPLAAAVWQAPRLIGVSVWAALAGATFLIMFSMGTAHLKEKSPMFNKNAELRNQYYDRCILNFVNQGIRASNTRAHLTCVSEADAYRARLESRGN
jgi:hypothetical protein